MRTLSNQFAMRREARSYDSVCPANGHPYNALDECFRRGRYLVPRNVRRYIRRPAAAYAHRPRMMMAISTLVWVIGRFHAGSKNFAMRGCGLGEGGGFFLAREGLSQRFPDLTPALVREAIGFLLEIRFIERLSPKGDLIEVRRPKNAKTHLGYFRYGQKAAKDALGRIRAPLTFYRLGKAARELFAKLLSPLLWQAVLGQEPVWRSLKNSSNDPNGNEEGLHTGCADYDRAGHDPSDPRFSRWNPPVEGLPDPNRRSPAQKAAAEAQLEALKRQREPLRLSSASLAIFNRPVGGLR